VDLQVPARLPAATAHPPPAPEPDGHDHPLQVEADVDDGRSRPAKEPLECGGNAHVVLLGEPLTFRTASSLPPTAAARSRYLRKLERKHPPRNPCSPCQRHPSFTPNSTGDLVKPSDFTHDDTNARLTPDDLPQRLRDLTRRQ
jgi:hypothetical protein